MKVIIFNLASNRFLTSYRAIAEGKILHLSPERASFDQLPDGAALDSFNKYVPKEQKLPAETADADAKAALHKLVKDNIDECLVEVPAPKEKASKRQAAKEGTHRKASKGGEKRGRKAKVDLAGKKLHKTGTFKGHAESQRRKTYESVKEGMLFETFVANGGSVSDLRSSIKDGHIKAV